jgi:hypothetical protein
MATLRDRLGHFLPQQAEAEAEVTDDAKDDAGDLVPLDAFSITAEIVRLRDLIEELRNERKGLLALGDIDGVAAVDAAIARAELGRESLGARLGAAQAAQLAAEHGRRVEAQQALLPRLHAVHAERDRLAYELWQAVDVAAAVEVEAERIGISIGDNRSPPDAPLTRYLWQIWVRNHVTRVGLITRAA